MFKFMKKIKNNKASIAMNRVIMYLLLLVAIAFMLDVVILLTQNVVTSYEAAYYAEKVSIQGGILGRDYVFPGPSKKACNSCMVNSDFSSRISESLKYFVIAPGEWDAKITTTDDNEFFIHKDGTSTSLRATMDYMDIGLFTLRTEFRPIFSGWLWPNDVYIIEKPVPFVIEYIPN